MNEFEMAEARYDAMPPEVARALRTNGQDPLRNRLHRLRTEISFARRMFRTNHRARNAGRHRDPKTRRNYNDDLRHWWHRYRSAQASAAQVGSLLALKALNEPLLKPGKRP